MTCSILEGCFPIARLFMCSFLYVIIWYCLTCCHNWWR